MQNDQQATPETNGHTPNFTKEFGPWWMPDPVKEDVGENKERNVYLSFSHCNEKQMRRYKQNCSCPACSASNQPVVIKAAVCPECDAIRLTSPIEICEYTMPPVPEKKPQLVLET